MPQTLKQGIANRPFAFEERDYLAETLETAGFRHVDIVAAKGSFPSAVPVQRRKRRKVSCATPSPSGGCCSIILPRHRKRLPPN